MIKYCVIKTEPYLTQYYDLVMKMYTRTAPEFYIDDQEKNYNMHNGNLVCAVVDEQVVAGTRLVISSPIKRIKLPLEEYGIDLAFELPHFKLENKVYAEWGRLVADPDIPDKKILVDNVARFCVNLCVQQHCKYLFGAPSIMMHRRYEQIFELMSLGFKRVIPENDKEYFYHIIPGYPVYIAVTDLSEVSVSYPYLPYDKANVFA